MRVIRLSHPESAQSLEIRDSVDFLDPSIVDDVLYYKNNKHSNCSGVHFSHTVKTLNPLLAICRTFDITLKDISTIANTTNGYLTGIIGDITFPFLLYQSSSDSSSDSDRLFVQYDSNCMYRLVRELVYQGEKLPDGSDKLQYSKIIRMILARNIRSKCILNGVYNKQVFGATHEDLCNSMIYFALYGKFLPQWGSTTVAANNTLGKSTLFFLTLYKLGYYNLQEYYNEEITFSLERIQEFMKSIAT